MVGMLWLLNSFVGFIFAAQAGKDYCKQHNRLGLYMFLLFICFGLCSLVIAVIILAAWPSFIVTWTWGVGFLLVCLLSFPVYFKYFISDCYVSIDLSIVMSLFILGLVSQSALWLALISTIIMGIFYFGCYEWWRNVR